MLRTVEGIYRRGRIKLVEKPQNVHDETRVIVTFLEPSDIDLEASGINRQQAADLRARLAAFADDWESNDMSIYDNYDASKAAH